MRTTSAAGLLLTACCTAILWAAAMSAAAYGEVDRVGPAKATAQAAAAERAAARAASRAAERAAKRSRGATPAKAVADAAPPAASAEQLSAASQVYFGEYQCEFKQVIRVEPSAQYPAYVELRHGKASYLMKPVLSPIGAIRLEDVKGQTLMIQIANKSMLMNVKTATRLVDECINPRQRAPAQASTPTADLAAANAAGTPPPK